MVLGLAALFVLTAIGPLVLPIQANATTPAASAPATREARHTHSKTTHQIAVRPARRAATHSGGCSSVRSSRRGRVSSECRGAARIRETHGTARVSRRGQHPHQVGEPAAPAPDQKTQTAETEAVPDAPAEPASAERAPAPVVHEASLSRKQMLAVPPLRGSLTSLERQNAKAEAEGLERIEDEDDLSDRITHKLLVPVPASAALTVNANLPEHHRYCRPWTARFLIDLAHAHEAQFHSSFEVSSAVRTVEYQKHLMEINGNAAAAEGDVVSPHLTGATIDIAKSGMSRQEIGWMRYWLLRLQTEGKIDVEEEFQQSCFHITVYKSYVPARPASSIAGAKPSQRKSSTSKTRQISRDLASAAPTLGR
jgi:hypothetical protein